MTYLRNLWAALVAKPELTLVEDGWLVVRSEYVAGLENVIAEHQRRSHEQFTNRSAASRKAHESRKASRAAKESQ